VASAKIHLDPSFPNLQRELRDRIARVHELARIHGIGLVTRDHTPIVFIPCGQEAAMFAIFHALQRRGYYVAPSLFPAVPRGRSGLRLTVSLHNGVVETERLMETIGHEIRKVPPIVEFQKQFVRQ
jgi:7-keto-8-aminopelargonate synthetase-like enzyme